MLSYVENLIKHDLFSEKDLNIADKQPATALLWTYYFLAQHFDYMGCTVKAMDYIDQAIEHTPTLIELFVAKARIYKVSFNQQNWPNLAGKVEKGKIRPESIKKLLSEL